MKKLMVAAAVVAFAAVSQAANFKWQSGTVYLPDTTKDGAFSSTAASKEAGFVVHAYAFESSSSASFSSLAAGALYEAYSKGTIADMFKSDANVTSLGTKDATNAGLVNYTGTMSLASGVTGYAALLYVYNDGSKDWYIENFTSESAGASAVIVADLAKYQGGSYNSTPKGTEIKGWTAAPEPTSGMLLLLGVAGLALRRRRA